MTLLEVGGDFVAAVVDAVAPGLVVSLILAVIQKRVQDSTLDTSISLMAPCLAYLSAQFVHGCGILAAFAALELTGDVFTHDPALVAGGGGAGGTKPWLVYSTGNGQVADSIIQIRRSGSAEHPESAMADATASAAPARRLLRA